MKGRKIRKLLGIGMLAIMLVAGSGESIVTAWGAANQEQNTITVPKEEISKEETPKEEMPKEEMPKEETPKEEMPKEEIRKEEIPEQVTPEQEPNSEVVPETKPEEKLEAVLNTIFTEEVTEEELAAMTKNVKSDFTKILDSETDNASKKQWINLLNQYLGQQKQVYENRELQTEPGIDSSIQAFGEERRAKILDYQAACQIQFVESDPYVIVKDITLTDKRAVMNVYEWVFITYEDQGIESTSGFGFDHVITFEEVEDDWNMVQDTFSDQSLAYLDSPSYQAPLENLEGSGEMKMKRGRTAMPQARYAYSPDKAVAYADKYALQYNPAYSNYNPNGGDCANFVSQSLQAGGMPMNDGWYYTSYQNVSSSWINCSSQVNYFKNQGKFIDYPDSADVKKGNPVWYYRGARWGHAAICVGTNASGTPVINAHNNDRYHVTWTLGFDRCSTVQLNPDVGEAPKIDWVKDANGWRYYYQENTYYPGSWGTVRGNFYLFGEDGYMKTGWQKTDGKYYYLGGADDGSMKYGWQTIDGKRYYLGAANDGAMKTGWQTIDGKKYYLGAAYDGEVKTGWQIIDGKYYYLGAANDGVMKTGWQVVNNQWYYLGAANDGVMKTGWQIINNQWYYLGDTYDGAMKTEWQKIKNQWYYFGNIYDGAMKTRWQQIWGEWYYLGAENDGAMKTGWQQIWGSWYFMHANGKMAKNQWIGSYYLGSNGAMMTNTWIGRYYVNNSGLWTETK